MSRPGPRHASKARAKARGPDRKSARQLRGRQPGAPVGRRALLAGLMIMVAGLILIAHWPALSARALSIDDGQYLIKNQLVQNPSWGSARRFLTEVCRPSTVSGYYQPLAMISLMLDYAAGGRVDHLEPFHRTSLALHALNALLLVVLVHLLFGRPWVAAMAGLLFGVHPLTVEPIPWVGERKTLLAAFFALWCLIFYVRYARTGSWKSYAACFLMYLLALMSKPTSTPLPVLLLVLDWWPLDRLGRRAVVEKVPLLVVALLFAIITVISQGRAGVVTMPGTHTPARIPLILCHNIIFYLYKIVWPADLSSHYPVPKPLSPSNGMVLAGLVGTCVLIPLLLISLRWTRALLAGWLFFFMAIFPTMGVIGFTNVIASDKFAYLPSVGLVLALAWLATGLWAAPSGQPGPGFHWRQIAILVSAGLLAGSSMAATRRQLAHWRDTESLCRRMMAVAPQAASPHFGLGLHFKSQGRLDQAIAEYREALRLQPGYAEAHNNLANALVQQGRLAPAIDHYREAIRHEPGLSKAHFNLGLILSQQGRTSEAIANFRKVLQLNDEYPEGHYQLAKALVKSGSVDEGIEHYEKALQLDPGSAETLTDLGVALAGKGSIDQAIAHYTRAVQLEPGLAQAHNNLAVALIGQGRIDQAVEHFTKALQLKPDDPYTCRNLANALAEGGRPDEAVAYLTRALQLKRDFVQAYKDLGSLLARRGEIDQAIARYREALRFQPDDADTYCRLGDLWSRTGRLDQAVSAYQQALRLEPRHRQARNGLNAASAKRAGSGAK